MLGEGVAGSANPRQVGLEAARAALEAAVRRAFAAAGLPFEPARVSLHAGVAGLATEADIAAFTAPPHPYAALSAEGDSTLTLRAFFGGEPGVLLMLGTGCIALARARDGRLLRRNGWGFPLERGGGADLGLEALRLGLAAWENGEDTPLAARLRAEFESPRAVMDWARGKASGDYARFAPLLLEAHAAGDAGAAAVLENWAALCRRLVAELRAESAAVQVGVWGGLAPALLRLTELEGRIEPRMGPLEAAVLEAERLRV